MLSFFASASSSSFRAFLKFFIPPPRPFASSGIFLAPNNKTTIAKIINNSVVLQYEPSDFAIEKLRNKQINSIIIEKDGTYFIDQLTMLKKRSKLNLVNVVKTIQKLRKEDAVKNN